MRLESRVWVSNGGYRAANLSGPSPHREARATLASASHRRKRKPFQMDEMISSMLEDATMAQDRDLPPLTALNVFYAAGTTGSFQEAARRLAVTPSAVSHQVRALERFLGTPLFVREARRVRLNAEGRAFLRVVASALMRIGSAADRLRAETARITTLRISALPLFTNVWLIPRLEAFERAHPEIVLDIETTNRLVDFSRERVDLAIRNVSKPSVGIEFRKLIDTRPVPMCTPALRKTLHKPADLAHNTLIHVSARPDSWPRWLAAVGCPDLRAKRDLSFDQVPAALEAAARGRGIAMGMDPIVWDAPIARKLVRAFPQRVEAGAAYYLVYRKTDLARPRLRTFVDWLLAEMAAYKRGIRSLSTR